MGWTSGIYGLHSLRAGGASAAANAGVPDRMFKRHGRWRSENAKDGYIACRIGYKCQKALVCNATIICNADLSRLSLCLHCHDNPIIIKKVMCMGREIHFLSVEFAN